MTSAEHTTTRGNYFDSHCHLDFEEFDGDRAELLDAARAAGIGAWLVPGTSEENWDRAIALTEIEGVFAAVGFHPWWAADVVDVDDAVSRLGRAIERPGVRALGECGLDGVRNGGARGGTTLDVQKRVFEAQLRLARERDVPLVLHQVKAQEEFRAALDRVGVGPAGGIVHGFSGDRSWAQSLVRRGLVLGVGPRITRVEGGRKLRKAIEGIATAQLVVETDAPDQRPETSPARSRGEPADLVLVLRALGVLFGREPREIGRETAETARRVYRLDTK